MILSKFILDLLGHLPLLSTHHKERVSIIRVVNWPPDPIDQNKKVEWVGPTQLSTGLRFMEPSPAQSTGPMGQFGPTQFLIKEIAKNVQNNIKTESNFAHWPTGLGQNNSVFSGPLLCEPGPMHNTGS